MGHRQEWRGTCRHRHTSCHRHNRWRRQLNATTGAWAEALAEKELSANGLRLLESNYRRKCGELDLVMQDKGTLVFVEVRYRASDRWGGALASITRTKQRRLINAASSYLKQHPEFRGKPCRFDVIAITGSVSEPDLKWVRSAFGAT